MDAEKDLGSQQEHLAKIDYDLRITNLAEFIHSKLKFRHDETIRPKLIDIGAGNGLFLKFFKRNGYKVTGRELEDELVANMKKDPQLKGIDIKQGDITKIKGNEEYDVVVASDVIEHIKDDKKALSHLWTFVKPGGQLVITVPAHQYLYGKRDEAWGHFRRYSKAELQSKLEALGAQVEFIGFWNFVGYFVYYFYEKVLHKQINEEMRYSKSLKGLIVRSILDRILKFEKAMGGTPIGLTLVAVARK